MASRSQRDREADPITLALLKPADEVVLKTPQGVEFEISDELDRLLLTRGLTARNKTNDFLITDDDARDARTPRPTGLPGDEVLVTFVNPLPVPVQLYEIRGRNTSLLRLHPGESQSRNIRVGTGVRVRSGDQNGTKLGLFVIPPPKGAEQPVLQVTDQYQFLRRIESKDPSARNGSYDIVKAEAPAPDPADTKYIRYGHQNIGYRTLNGWSRPVRRVTLSGVDLDLDDADRSGFQKLYEGAEDIAELWIDADTITIKKALRFPATKVYVCCRSLRFEGNSFIDTTPTNSAYRDPSKLDGEDGEKGGDFFVMTSDFSIDQRSGVKRFRARGSRGQDPDPGGVETSPTVRNLEVMTTEKWDEFFKAENRRLKHEEVFGNLTPGVVITIPFPDFKIQSRSFPNICYIEINNSYWLDHFHLNASPVKIERQWGMKESPGTGGRGKRAGKPGLGGAGGNLTCSLKKMEQYADLAGGNSGTPLGPTPGGSCGTPNKVSWLFFDCRPVAGANQEITLRGKTVSGEEGRPSEAGPPAKAPKGADGKTSVIALDGAVNWVSPINLSLVVQFARDACAAGYAEYAVAILSPYVASVAGKAVGAQLQQPLSEARELLRLSQENADYFGKPPGWVPTLSLQSAAGIYDALLPSAMNQLYASYYIEKVAKSRQDKQKALDDLRLLLNKSSEQAKSELEELRKPLPKAMDDLAQLLVEIEDASNKLYERKKILLQRADRELQDQEQKEAISAAFKIAGAVAKALPLPEPYQSAAGALGTVLDVTGDFIDGGSSDDAFKSLKTQVAEFTSNKDGIVEYLNSPLNAEIDVSGLEKDAAAARKTKEQLEEKYGVQAEQLEQMKAKQKEVLDAKKEALIYSRAKDAKEREAIVKKAGKLTTDYQESMAALEAASAGKTKEYLEAKAKIGGIESEIAAKKAQFDLEEAERDKKKEANAKMVATRMKQVQNVANSVASIAGTMNKLAVSRSQLNSKFDQALAKLKTQDPEFSALAQRIKFLETKKTTISSQISQLASDISNRTEKITKNMLAVNEIAGQMATNKESLDANALVYIQSMGQDAHATLTRFLYYSVKAFEYYMVAPWTQSYVSTQRLFDDLRRVLEPSAFKIDTNMDPKGDKQKGIQAILAADDPRKGGMLSAAEFDLLKVVYEKPLLDMGKQLAGELMESNGPALKESKSTVTLSPEWLSDLNARVLSKDKQDQVLFNLVDLRQVGRSVEKQRISNIRVIGVEAVKIGRRFPDTIKFVFEHIGKSIVRSRGRFFAFEPQSGARNVGVSFETQGGRTAAHPVGWVERAGEKLTHGRLGAESLWQPDRTPQENLLSKLMNNTATLSLSEFRPGAFSDFLLKLDISPPECKVELTEIVLEVSYEGGNASRDEMLICINNNVGMAVPVTTDVKDISGRSGGGGRYLGVFNSKQMSAAGHLAVRVQAPSRFGMYALRTWEVNGEPTSISQCSLDVAKDSYILVDYVRGDDASGDPRVSAAPA